MHVIEFIHDLAIIMLTAGIVTVVFHLLRQPVVLGYIVAGVLIGPHTPPYTFVTNEETIRTLAELGVVFLLFSLGLEFSLRHLRQVGATALVSAIAGIVTMPAVSMMIARSWMNSMTCIRRAPGRVGCPW
jgi:monovalent cation:H+ antiporter-2, CPA2 family